MKRNLATKVHTTTIHNMSHEGRGIARIEGKAAFIQNALPQETVTFEVTRNKSDFLEGVTTEVLTPSPHRVAPRCPHYQICGGCSLQHLDSSAQITLKQQLLQDILQRIGHVTPQTMLPSLTAGSWHYRNKARLSVRYVEKKQATLIGFREKNNPRYITEITQCPILHTKVDAQIPSLRALLDSLQAPKTIAQIEVAAGDDAIALIFRNLAPLTAADEEKLRQFGESSGFILYLQPQGPDSVTLFYPEHAEEFLSYALTDHGIRLHFHPHDFTQIHARLNPKMINLALELMALDENDIVMDLFCGLGNFSLPLAKRCKTVIGVEGSEAMVKRAAMNATMNNITNALFYCSDLDNPDAFKVLLKQPITKLLLDPPRSGALEIVRQIDKLKPKKLVYVSCNPATLARDSDILVNQQGYRLTAAGVMDMFPHTAHVESIALFEEG